MSDSPNLPTSVPVLHEMIKAKEVKIGLLFEKIKHLECQLYLRKSEKLSKLQIEDDGNQLPLFAEEGAEETVEEKEEVEEISVLSHKRKKKGRKKMPESLPREDVLHDITEEEKRCNCGAEKSKIGEDVSEQLEITPPRFKVLRNIRYKYACKSCEGVDKAENESSVTIAPLPPQMIPKSIATPSLLAHILVSKFSDSLPFYRQEQQFKRYGVEISRSTMCNWSQKVASKCEPLLKLLRKHLLSGPLIQIDETRLQVLKEPGRNAENLSQMWLFRGGPPGQESVLFHYAPSRGGSVAHEFLGDYQGYVQTDGYSGYNFLDKTPGVEHAGCWAHVRRKFNDVLRATGDKKGKNRSNPTVNRAGKVMQTIQELYAIERNCHNRELSPELVVRERQEKAKPILEELLSRLRELSLRVPPTSKLGNAITYTLSQWPRLVKYLDNGHVRMDNNLAENAIRPFVVGRKNWLFSDRPEGAAATATMYSLVETAKANKLEPFHYLNYLFTHLPTAQTEEEYEKLLPQNLTPEILK